MHVVDLPLPPFSFPKTMICAKIPSLAFGRTPAAFRRPSYAGGGPMGSLADQEVGALSSQRTAGSMQRTTGQSARPQQ